MTWIGGILGSVFAALLLAIMVLAFSTLWDALPGAARSDAAWRDLLRDPSVRQATLRSIAVVLLASGLAAAVATPLAYVAVRNRPMVRAVLLALGLLPLAMPPFVIAAVLNGMATYAETRFTLPGPVSDDLRSLSLLVLAYALHGVPIVLLSLFIGLARLDRSLAESARTHGIPTAVAWYRITLPMLTPPFALAMAFLTLRILGDASAPFVLGRGDLLAPLLLGQLEPGGLSVRGAQLAMLIVALHALVFALTWPFLLAPKETVAPPQPTRGATLPVTLIALFSVGVLSLSPLVWLVKRVDWVQFVASSADLANQVTAGLSVSVSAALALLVIGLPAALLTRRSAVTGGVARLATALLLAVPGLVLAIGLAPFGASHGTDDGVTWPAFVPALAVALPFLPFVPHLAGHVALRPDRETADLARGLGAPPIRSTLRPLLPGVVLLSAVLASVGAALALIETTPLLVAQPEARPSLALDLLGSIVAEPTGRHWAPTATLLTGTLVSFYAGAALFLRLGSSARRPDRRGRPA